MVAGFLSRWEDESGQMTVELALVIPVVIVVAVIAVNALQFFSLCASFDRVVGNEVRIHAVSPSFGSDAEAARAAVEAAVGGAFSDVSNVEVTVARAMTSFDLDRFTATMTYHPTLFGMGLKSEVFGVPLPVLSHSAQIVVDSYKPGVFL